MMTGTETDYVVVGAATARMAFVDSLIEESDCEVVLVDRRDRPGGHWNDVYPFVGGMSEHLRDPRMVAAMARMAENLQPGIDNLERLHAQTAVGVG